MSFVKKIWKDRKTEYPNRRKLIFEDGTSKIVKVERAEGNISEEGDAFKAEIMNDLESRIETEFTALNNNFDGMFLLHKYTRTASFQAGRNWLEMSIQVPDGYTPVSATAYCNYPMDLEITGIFIISNTRTQVAYSCIKAREQSIILNVLCVKTEQLVADEFTVS